MIKLRLKLLSKVLLCWKTHGVSSVMKDRYDVCDMSEGMSGREIVPCVLNLILFSCIMLMLSWVFVGSTLSVSALDVLIWKLKMVAKMIYEKTNVLVVSPVMFLSVCSKICFSCRVVGLSVVYLFCDRSKIPPATFWCHLQFQKRRMKMVAWFVAEQQTARTKIDKINASTYEERSLQHSCAIIVSRFAP